MTLTGTPIVHDYVVKGLGSSSASALPNDEQGSRVRRFDCIEKTFNAR